MGNLTAFAKNTVDFVDRNKVAVIASMAVVAGVLTSSALLHGSNTSSTQPAAQPNAHTAVKHTSAGTTPKPAPQSAALNTSADAAVHSSAPKAAGSSVKVSSPAPANAPNTAAPNQTASSPSPSPAPSPSPSPTPAPVADPLPTYDPATDTLYVPRGGSSVSLEIQASAVTQWFSFYPAYSINDGPVQGDKPNAPYYIVFETDQTSLPLTGDSITIHVNAAADAVVGSAGEVGVVYGSGIVDYTKIVIVDHL